MSIVAGIFIFIIGCFVGYLICTISWLKSIEYNMTLIEIELAKVKAELEVEDGNVD